MPKLRKLVIGNVGYNAATLAAAPPGLETLHLRVKQHSENAMVLANWLKDHPLVEWVNYTGFQEHSSHDKAKKYMRDGLFGPLIGFGIKGGMEAGKKFIDSVQICSHLANIGDAKSQVIHPASTTHQQLTPEEQQETGVTEDYVRLSVGIEDVDDLKADIDQTLKASQ